MHRPASRPRALVVSNSFTLRSSYASVLEDEGWLALEACSADEVLWCLVASRLGEAGMIELVVADAETPGLQALLGEVHGSPQPPAMVFVGRGRSQAVAAPRGVEWVADGRCVETLRRGLERACASVVGPAASDGDLGRSP